MIIARWDHILCLTFAALCLVLGVLAAVVGMRRRWWMFAAPLAVAVIISLMVQGWLRVIILDTAAILAVGLVWEGQTPAAARAARLYLLSMLLAMVSIAAGLLLGGEAVAAPAGLLGRLVPFLLLFGFALKLALIPFSFWLPVVAEAAHPLTTAMIISLVDMAAFNELISQKAATAWLFQTYAPLWIALAVLSMLAGSLLALGQRDLKRMLAFSTIDDLGYLLLALVISDTSGLGIEAARIGLITHASMKVLLFGALAVAESRLGHPLTLADRGLAAQYPLSAVAFIVGAFGMIGIPPTLGFVSRWRIYLSAGQASPWLLLVMLAATGIGLLVYVRVIHTVWLGAGDASRPAGEPRPAAWALGILVILAISAGIYPGLWTVFLH